MILTKAIQIIVWKISQNKFCKYTPIESLSSLLNAILTKTQLLTRNKSLEKSVELYPSYRLLREAKSKCFPKIIYFFIIKLRYHFAKFAEPYFYSSL